MRLRPRHYLLLIVLAALAALQVWRVTRVRHPATGTAAPAASQPRGNSPIWAQFDALVQVRDGSNEQFQPALQALTTALAAPAQDTSPNDLAALQSCRLWLLFYRQEVLHPDSRAAWKAQTTQHTDFCASHHADFAQ